LALFARGALSHTLAQVVIILAIALFRLLEAVLEEPAIGIDYSADDGLSK
jgi:hypothetical protein